MLRTSMPLLRPLVRCLLPLTLLWCLALRPVDAIDVDADSTIYLPLVTGAALVPPAPAWLNHLNMYRDLANLPPVADDPSLHEGTMLHARYMVKNDVEFDPHREDPAKPFYTEQGNEAAGKSITYADPRIDLPDEQIIDGFMGAPFHALYLLNPALHRVGYAKYSEADGGVQLSVVINIQDGIGDVVPGIRFPVKWPADNTTVPVRSHFGENPSPLTSCPGYTEPAGLPVLLQLGPGFVTPNVTEASISRGGTVLASCEIDQTNYRHDDAATQDVMRQILDYFDAVVLIPRAPLEQGATYDVRITSSGQTHAWSFTVAPNAR
jgi:hypothetical protein